MFARKWISSTGQTAINPVYGTWERYASNPVLTAGAAGKWDEDFRYFLRVVRNTDGTAYRDGDGHYWATYAGTDTFNTFTQLSDDEVGLCYSSDLLNWTIHTVNAPHIALTSLTLYSADVVCNATIYDAAEDKFYMFCQMNNNAASDSVKVGLWTTTGAITNTPVYQGGMLYNGSGAGKKDNQDVYTFCPYRLPDGSWMALYGAHSDSGEYGCLRATADTLGGVWTKYGSLTSYLFTAPGSVPVVPTVAWLDGFGTHWVVCDNYLTLDQAYLFSSPDGITYTYRGVAFERGASGQWDDVAVYDFEQIVANGQVFTYYTAQSGGTPFVQVGAATSWLRPALV